MSPSSVLSRSTLTEPECSRLRFAFQASSFREAVSLAAELRAIAPDVTDVRPSLPGPPGPREWTVALTTPPVPLTLAVVKSWEGVMLAVERRQPGCRFLGWTTCGAPKASNGWKERAPGHDAARACQRRSQRELVTASLLRCPPSERRGVVHGRAA